jgi:hypothetical protein
MILFLVISGVSFLGLCLSIAVFYALANVSQSADAHIPETPE